MSQHSSILPFTEHESAFFNLTQHRTWVCIIHSYSSQNMSQHHSLLPSTELESAFLNLTLHRTWVSILQSYPAQNMSQHYSILPQNMSQPYFILLITEHDSVFLNITHHRTSVSTGFLLFSSDKIPWLFQYFVHFPWPFMNIFYGLHSIFIFF